MSEQYNYLDASIKTAQYLSGLTTHQDIWSETGKVLINFFGADLCSIGERRENGEIIGHNWNFSERYSGRRDLGAEIRETVAEVLENGFLTSRIISTPDPLSVAFLPITQENRVIAVLVAGQLTSEPLPKGLLDVYLAVAGLVGSTAQRLASERELRIHRSHLEELVKERTAELTEANEQLQSEINRRRGAEETLRQSVSLLTATLDSTADGIFVVDREGKIVNSNQRFAQLWRIPRDVLASKSDEQALEFVLGQLVDPGAFISRVRELYHESEAESFDVLRFKDGRVFERYSRPQRIENRVVGRVWSFRDVTERRLAEEKLRKSEEMYSSLFTHIGIGVAIISPDMEILYLNPVMEKMNPSIDVTRRPICYESFNVPPRYEVCSYCPTIQTLRDGKVHTSITETPTEAGILNLRIIAAPVLAADGSVSSVIEVVEDMTERMRVEHELRRLNAYNRSLIEASLDPLVTIGPDGRITDVNAATEEVTGRLRDELVGTDFSDYFTDPEAARAGYRQVFRDGSVRDYPLEILNRDRLSTPVLYNATVYRDQAGATIGVFAAARDITERKQAEAERLEMERRLLHSQKLESIGVLAGGIAHDFNNLLTVILGNLEMALMRIEADSPVCSLIDQALLASNRAASLVRQMLAYAGRGHFVLQEIDLNDVIRENADLFRTSVARNVTLTINSSPALPTIKADQGQVQQVIMNLIINASEAIGANPGAITVCTGVQECDGACLSRSRTDEPPAAGMFVYLEVADTGCGMDEETQQRLFEPFFTTKFTGRGLGMSALLGIVRSHQGAILLESRVGRGSTIRVLFPASGGKKAIPCEDAAPANGIDIPRGFDGTVLVVDDEEMVRELCMRYVRKLGLTALGAADGIEAISRFRERADEICLVILDMTMPNMDGVQTFHELRHIRPDARVIISSGFSEEDISEQFAVEKPSGFISKPFKLENLSCKIALALRWNV